jgi:flavin-dependent dehydrogenase
MNASPADALHWDVVIFGGALAGAGAATLLRRARPDLRVLIVEKSPAFTRRVGEATVETSAYFLGRVLGLTQYLNEAHLVKQGMRFWFANETTRTLEDCSEIGGRYLSRVPAYQVDRSTLDEEVLRRACAGGAHLLRPAAVQSVELQPGGEQSITVRVGESIRVLRARWVVDASGFAALLARQNGWWRANTAHPTASAWSRWRNVKDWDGAELAERFPKYAMACHGVRFTATNHFVGHGWWAWCIPLKGGDTSIGVVFDQRFVNWAARSGDGSPAQRVKQFLMEHPVAREIMADATWIDGDVHWRKNLPYSSTTYAGDGFVLVGDAAAFLDPFYSPGMDWVSFTVTRAVALILAQLKGEPIEERLREHNLDFSRSYERWFEAIYRDKYEYMGDFELMRLAFTMDVGLYYLGVASQPFKQGNAGLNRPVYTTGPSVPVYYLMRTYNRRLASIARARRARGVWGRHNAHRRFMAPGFSFAGSDSLLILKAMARWGMLELREGWRTWFRRTPKRSSVEMAESTAPRLSAQTSTSAGG